MSSEVYNFENYIRSYVVSAIKEKYPNIDASANSTFDDIIVKPLVTALAPVIALSSNIDITATMPDASMISEGDMDTIGENNYMLSRMQGVKASTTVTMRFSSIPAGETISIPAAILFTAKTGVQFKSIDAKQYSRSAFTSLYSVDTMTYNVPIYCEAVATGTDYNVTENQITTLSSVFSGSEQVESVTNLEAVTDGEDKETNASYFDRIKQYYVTRYEGTEPGYISELKLNFPEIKDVLVVGYGDTNMTRDVVSNVHIGGKTDIYVYGCSFEGKTLMFNCGSPKLLLSETNYGGITASSISGLNLTDTTKTVTGTLTTDSTLSQAIYTINASSYDGTKSSKIRIVFTEDGVQKQLDFYVFDSITYELESPVESISSVYNTEDPSVSYDSTHYSIVRKTSDGTVLTSASPYYKSTQETSYVTLSNFESVMNGTPINVDYVLNKTLSEIRDYYYVSENRIITADVLHKESEKVYINIAFQVVMKNGYTLDDKRKSVLNSSVASFFSDCGIGKDIKESDIVGYLYQDEKVKEFLEYVVLPFKAFYIPSDITADITDTRTGTTIQVGEKANAVLNKFSPTIPA